MKKYFVSIIALLLPLLAGAQIVEHVYTKNGSVFKGYIASQGNGKVEVKSFESRVISQKASISSAETRKLSSLPAAMKAYVLQNPELAPDTTKIQFANVTVGSSPADYINFNDCLIIQSGAVTEFVCFQEKTVSIPFDNYQKVTKVLRPYNEYSWIVSSFEKLDGTIYEGQLKEQVKGSYMTIQTVGQGLVSVMPGDIRNVKYKAYSADRDIFTQARVLDQVIVIDGKGSSTVNGIITENAQGSYVIIRTKDNSVRKIEYKDIKSIGKTRNDDYVSVTDFPIPEGVFYCKGDTVSVKKLEKNDNSILVGQEFSMEEKVGATLTFYTNCPENAQIYLVKTKTVAIDVTAAKEKGKFVDWFKFKKKDAEEEAPVNSTVFETRVDFKDIFLEAKPISKELTPLRNTKLTMSFKERGIYLLFVQGSDNGIVINVKE